MSLHSKEHSTNRSAQVDAILHRRRYQYDAAASCEPLEDRRLLSTVALQSAVKQPVFLQSTTTMPVAQAGGGGAAIGGKAYFLSSHGGTLQTYTAATESWTTTRVQTLPNDASIVGTAVGQKVVFVGAWAATSRSPLFPENNAMLVFDTTRKQSRVFTIPIKAQWYGAFGVGSHVIIDGTDNAGKPHVLDFNFSNGRWRVLSVPGGGSGNEVVIGHSIEFVNSHINIYNPDHGTWTQRAFVSTFSDSFFGVAVIPPIAVGTKYVRSAGAGQLRILDTVTGEESVATAIGTEALNGRLLAVGNKIIFAGGSNTGPISEVSISDLAHPDQSEATTLSVLRTDIASTAVGAKGIFAGGDISLLMPDAPTPAPLNNVDIFTDTTPSAVLSGDLSGNIGHRDQVTILNTGDADLAGPYGIQLYASLDRTLNGAILIGTRGVTAPLPAGASATFGVRTILPKDTPAGTYHLLAAISDGTGHLTPIAAEDATFRVGRKQVAAPANTRSAKSMAGAFTRASHSARQWT